MYFKLTLRNVKRSTFDYFLYIFTMIIFLSIMFISHYISLAKNIVGLETIALPILILFILIILVNYINTFMLKQRAKEFANYMLLGMEQKNLIRMFLLEFFIIGFLCFFISSIFCLGICFLLSDSLFPFGDFSFRLFFFQSMAQTFFYFCIMEFLSMYRIKKYMNRLEIRELMIEKKLSEPLNTKRYSFWNFLFISSIFCLIIMFCGMVFLPQGYIVSIVSIIAIPIITTIFTSYKCLFQHLAKARHKANNNLYQNNYLYLITQITRKHKTNAFMIGVFCICLIFSAQSFIVGTFFLNAKLSLFDNDIQKWFGFLQICICIIFIVIYFSILSLQQLIEIKQQVNELKILHFLGKTQTELKSLLKKQILINLSVPTYMCFFILLLGTPFVNYRLNIVLPVELNNTWLKSLCGFSLCFILLYICYFSITYFIGKRTLESQIEQNKQTSLY